jgi:urease accessory protein
LLLINQTSGNIFANKQLADDFKVHEKDRNYKRLLLQRSEMEKTRLRKKTNDGTDVGINLEHGIMLQNGDVVMMGEIKILIEQKPEKIITVKIKDPQSAHVSVVLGHIIGNRHRPIAFGSDNSVSFPIQHETELDLFKSLFGDIIGKIELVIEEKVFQPHKATNVHDHG